MASLFTNAVNFFGNAIKDALTPDTMRDYQHASRLFVGNNFERMPKYGFLFHVFFDIDRNLSEVLKSQPSELGLMVKSTDLPKFTVATKTYNSYNRPNIVQSKIAFDPISITFHDDSANLVRNFWYDYYRYHYRDSDHGDNASNAFYKKNYKYSNRDLKKFGYTTRDDYSESVETIRPYLRSIRIYSLHQKRFSEYILINPVIKNFRHGQHDYSNGTGIMESTMTVEYETVLYQSGATSRATVNGFTELHYDQTRSPLRTYGGVKSIFGTGGLMDTAGSVLADIEQGNFASAIFKTAQGINVARSMNLKRALVSELTGIYTSEATRAIQSATPAVIDQINRTMQNTVGSPVTVPTVAGIEGATSNQYSGIPSTSSVAALAGAAIILNSTPINNQYRRTPNTQANNVTAPTNYAPRLPLNANATVLKTADSTLLIGNDQDRFNTGKSQTQVNVPLRRQDLNNRITSLTRRIQTVGDESAAATQQIANTTQAIAAINTKIAATQALTPATPEGVTQKNLLLAELGQQVQVMNNLKNIAQANLTRLDGEIASLKQDLTSSTTEYNSLLPTPA